MFYAFFLLAMWVTCSVNNGCTGQKPHTHTHTHTHKCRWIQNVYKL